MKVYDENYAVSCYFRTAADYPNRKCMLQLTEKCNFHCKHCFVSAGHLGKEMDFLKIRDMIIPQLVECGITRVTLTGGEPLLLRQSSANM